MLRHRILFVAWVVDEIRVVKRRRKTTVKLSCLKGQVKASLSL